MDPVRPIRTEAEHDAAMAAYERFFDQEPAPGTAEGDAFELLGLVIARYEEDKFPISAADPVASIALVMEARGLKQADLGRVLGSRSRASEIMSRKRDLSLGNIRALHHQWGIPAESLIGEVRRARAG